MNQKDSQDSTPSVNDFWDVKSDAQIKIDKEADEAIQRLLKEHPTASRVILIGNFDIKADEDKP